MKKQNKVLLVLMMTLSLMLPSFGGLYVVFARPSIATIGAQIVIMQMPSQGEIGTSLNIPKGSSPDGTVTTKIFDPKGAVVFDSSLDTLPDGPGDTYLFNPILTGTYSVQYAVISADESFLASTYSQKYKIAIKGDRPIFDFADNSNILLPRTANFEQLIVLPYPTTYASNGEVVAVEDVAQNISITVKNPSGNTVVLGTTNIDGVDYYNFTTAEAAGQGTYTIDYYYVDAVSGLTTRKAFELSVDSSFSASNIKLNYVLDGSMPTTGVLGNKVTLPKPVTRNQNAGNVLMNTYVDVKVEFINPNGADIEYAVENFEFRPVDKGDYRITYKIYDFYALQEEEPLGTYTYTMKDVKDTLAPQVQPVEIYPAEYMDDAEYTFVNAAYDIPSNVAVGATVYFPAIHAVDNLSLSSNLTYKRTIISSTNTITDLDHATDNLYGKHETVPYTFLTEGTYTVRYAAMDEASNERTVSYTLKVIDGFVDNEAPRITMPTIINYAKPGETVRFLKPTAIDYVSTSSTSTVDTRVKVKTYIYLGDNTGVMVEVYEDEEDSNYISFIVPNNITEDYLHVYVEAIDDGPNDMSGVNIASRTKKINILDINDTVAPSFAADEPVITDQDQGTVVNLPVVKFTDNDPTFLSVTVLVQDPNGNNVKVTGLQLEYELDTLSPGDADGMKVVGGRFSAILAGNYRITYTATDIAGNSYIKSYVQYIIDTQAPTFQLTAIPTNVEVGKTITLPNPTIIDNGVEIENQATTTIVFINSPAYSLVMATMQFTPLEEGTYTFKYLAQDSFGNTSESAVYSFVAKDTVKPVIILNDDIVFPLTAPLTRASESDPYDAIIIPDFTAFDEYNGVKEFSVVVKNPSNQTILDAKNGATAQNGTYSFVPTRDGIYTVTYSATDLAGNVTTDVRTVRVGDNAAPTLTIGNTTVNRPANQNLNSTITLDLSAITVVDDKDGNIGKNDLTTTGERKFTVKLTGPNGQIVSEVNVGQYNYKLEQAGEYTLTYTARDEAGNTKVESVSFQVAASAANPVIVTETLGIILIVLSLLVLGGVVVYFVKSRELIED